MRGHLSSLKKNHPRWKEYVQQTGGKAVPNGPGTLGGVRGPFLKQALVLSENLRERGPDLGKVIRGVIRVGFAAWGRKKIPLGKGRPSGGRDRIGVLETPAPRTLRGRKGDKGWAV